MSAGQLKAEVAKRDNTIKNLEREIDTYINDIHVLQTKYLSLRESSEAKIKQSEEDFIKCYKERTEYKKEIEKLRSELFHIKSNLRMMIVDRDAFSARASSLASDFYDLEQTRIGRLALRQQKRKARKIK